MKKILTVFALALSTPALSAGLDGFYTGGYVGMSSMTAESRIYGFDVELGKNDTSLGGYFGYEIDYGSSFVALEADFNVADTEVTQSSGSAKLSGTRKNSYGISVLGGIPFGDKSDIYTRFGFVNTDFESMETDGSTTRNYDTSETGYVFGLGSRFQLNSNLNLRMDYRYIQYSDFKFVDGGAEFDINEQNFTVGVQYIF